MKRRNFFKTLTAAFVAVSLDLGVVSEAILTIPKRFKSVINNPAYITAEYEDFIMMGVGVYGNLVERVGTPNLLQPSPPRFNFVDGCWERVHSDGMIKIL